MHQHCIRDRSIQYSIRRGDETEQVHIITKMTDQSGGGGGSPVWLGVALVFVGMVGKDLFITDQGRDLLIVISAANRLIGEVVQSRRRPLLGPSPG